jgi:hypothetical protein
MSKTTAQRIQAIVGLVGLLGAAGIKGYMLGWLDDWRLVAAVMCAMVAGFAGVWTMIDRRQRREHESMNAIWEERRTLRERAGAGAGADDVDRAEDASEGEPRGSASDS